MEKPQNTSAIEFRFNHMESPKANVCIIQMPQASFKIRNMLNF